MADNNDWIDLPIDQGKDDWTDVPEEEDIGIGGATTTKLAQGLTFGYSDEIAGWIDSTLGDVDYETARDIYRERQERADRQYPVWSGIVDVAGSILGPGKLIKGAKSLVGVAAAEGLGRSKAELAGEDKELGRAALDVGFAAGTAGLVGKLGPKILPAVKGVMTGTGKVAKVVAGKLPALPVLGEVAEAVPKSVSKLRQEAFHESRKDLESKLRNPKAYADELAGTIGVGEKLGVFKGTSKLEDVLKNTQEQLAKVGEKIGEEVKVLKEVAKRAEEPGRMREQFAEQTTDWKKGIVADVMERFQKLSDKVEVRVTDGSLSTSEGRRAKALIASEVESIRKSLEGSGADIFNQLRKRKTGLYKRTGDKAYVIGTKPAFQKTVLKDMGHELRQAEIAAVKGSVIQDHFETAGVYLTHLDDYHNLIGLENKLLKSVGRDSKSGFGEQLGIGSLGTGGIGLVVGGLSYGLGGIGLHMAKDISQKWLKSSSGKLTMARIKDKANHPEWLIAFKEQLAKKTQTAAKGVEKTRKVLTPGLILQAIKYADQQVLKNGKDKLK